LTSCLFKPSDGSIEANSEIDTIRDEGSLGRLEGDLEVEFDDDMSERDVDDMFLEAIVVVGRYRDSFVVWLRKDGSSPVGEDAVEVAEDLTEDVLVEVVELSETREPDLASPDIDEDVDVGVCDFEEHEFW